MTRVALRIRWALLISWLVLLPGAAFAADEPDLADLARIGADTLRRLEKEAAAWTSVIELPNGLQALVDETVADGKRRVEIALVQADKKHPLARIIERDGLWYVTDDEGNVTFRPYEAPLSSAMIYVFMARTGLQTVVDPTEPPGVFERMDGRVAIYRSPLPAGLKEQLEHNLRHMQNLIETNPKYATAESAASIAKMEELLDQGIEVRINGDTGIVEQSGSAGNRVRTRKFRWLTEVDDAAFDVSRNQWKGRTECLVADEEARNDVIFIKHERHWKPGQKSGESDGLLLDITNGELRRVPYPSGTVVSGCFSKDRQHVYFAGSVPALGSICIFGVDLRSGECLHLGGSNLETGMTMFPSLSPDGGSLAVVKLDQASGPIHSQVYLIDIESGESRPIGKPLDTTHPEWLPSGDGLILIARESRGPDRPSASTICKMGLDGELEKIRPGNFPRPLPDGRIFFEDPADEFWKTCDLKGENVTIVGDGLESYSFPAISPDGKRAIMMKFGGKAGPQPYVVDIATGEAQPIKVGPGLWSMPSWR